MIAAAALLLAGLLAGAPGEPPPNPIAYVEVPVSDLSRAIAFYNQLFGWSLKPTEIDGYAMALFPATDGAGASGALAKGDVYVPGKAGAIVYFRVGDIDAVLRRAEQAGAKLLYPKKAVGPGTVAEIEDSEGNRLALMGD